MKAYKLSKKSLYIIDLLLFTLIIALDRVTKYFVVIRLKNNPAYPLYKYLELNYLENTGAALGILKDQKYFFLLFSGLLLMIAVYCIYKTPSKRKYVAFHVFLIFISAGSVSNSTDRILFGYVIDFIHISHIDFPTFNVADIFVTLGAILMVILILIFFKEDDLNFLRFNEKVIRDIEKK